MLPRQGPNVMRHALPSPQLDMCREAAPSAWLHSGKGFPRPLKSAPTAVPPKRRRGPTAPFRAEGEAPQSREQAARLGVGR